MMKENSKHWLLQRLSALPLAVLFFYFIGQMGHMTSRSHADFTGWLKQPVNTVAAAVFILSAFYHAAIGVEEIIEDYVPDERKKLWKAVNNLSLTGLAAACLGALAKIFNG